MRAAIRTPSLETLRRRREEVIAAAEARQLGSVRVFGSVARREAGATSDVDLLVHPGEGASIFDLAGFMAEMEEMLGLPVDVVSDCGTGAAMDRIVAEAVPL